MSDDEQISPVTDKIAQEGNNHRAFHLDKTYADTGEKVGSDDHFVLTLVEHEAPLDREEGFVWYYIYDDPTAIPFETIDTDMVAEYRLDRVESSDKEDYTWDIVSKHEMDTLAELRNYAEGLTDSTAGETQSGSLMGDDVMRFEKEDDE